MNYPVGKVDEIRFVQIFAKHKGKWVLCFHKKRQKWEFPGGHVEEGEDPLTAAKRELYEETGAINFIITPLWDYYSHNNGRVYFADVDRFDELPDYDMEKIGFFDHLPENVTYNRTKMNEDLERVKKYMREHEYKE
ncbi:hypothetical protein J14TS2_07850 [Bacillus sp. J14TS2]|uniref:NUDIX domain-containing protein n=1 Tax=Bacillus sp. J14TS2 TaxID=2807188 RepID=UPI001B173142|nr:NUDIX domain-containing protein [Bacillus sp. J14TS2]GIN70310.1 hypothetical protein J14TS2_07850 [Bacillus sp. J14TS2]